MPNWCHWDNDTYPKQIQNAIHHLRFVNFKLVTFKWFTKYLKSIYNLISFTMWRNCKRHLLIIFVSSDESSLFIWWITNHFQTTIWKFSFNNAQCGLCKVYFSALPNRLRPTLKFEKCYSIKHILLFECAENTLF